MEPITMPQDDYGNNLDSTGLPPKWRFSDWDFPERGAEDEAVESADPPTKGPKRDYVD